MLLLPRRLGRTGRLPDRAGACRAGAGADTVSALHAGPHVAPGRRSSRAPSARAGACGADRIRHGRRRNHDSAIGGRTVRFGRVRLRTVQTCAAPTAVPFRRRVYPGRREFGTLMCWKTVPHR